MLELKSIRKVYKTANEKVEALKGVSIKFRKSEFVSILGQSGCGKTTLLNIIGGLDRYTSGDLIINGKSTKDFKDRDWDAYRNYSVGFVFQSYNLIPHQTVLANVELALTLSGVGKKERKQKAIKALEDVGLKEPYVGICPLVSGEIAEDFARYFVESEQKPTAIALGVLVDKNGVSRAGGYILSLMPDASDDIVTKIEENIKKIPSISKILAKIAKLDEIVKIITGDDNIELLEENIYPKYECNCSKEKFERGLISLGKTELEDILKEEKDTEILCHFCNKKYIFDKKTIKELVDNMDK